MIRRGDVFLSEAVVIAIEPGAEKGTRIALEMIDEGKLTRMSGAAKGYELIGTLPQTRHVYVTAERWAELVEEFGGQDMLLARKIAVADLGGRFV